MAHMLLIVAIYSINISISNCLWLHTITSYEMACTISLPLAIML